MKIQIIAGACLLALSASLLALDASQRPLLGGHGENVDAFIAQHDGNGDREVEWSEFEDFRFARYNTTDANGDRTVDEGEYVAEFDARWKAAPKGDHDAQIKQTKVRFGILDDNKDAKLSYGEYQASGKRLFEKVDRDGDGVVDGIDAKLPPKDPAANAAPPARD